MNDIGIKKMRVFLSAVEERSFTRASVRQNISQPAATIIINQIEEAVGVELFQRQGTSRKATLTEAGQKVADTFSNIVAGYETELSKIGDVTSDEREVREILVQIPYAAGMSEDWLNSTLETFGEFKIKLRVCDRAEIIEQIRSRKANLGIVDGDISDENTDYLQIGTIRMVLLAPRDICEPGQTNCNWTDLPDDTILFTGISIVSERRIHNSLKAVGKSANSYLEVNSNALLRKLVVEHGFPAIVPDVIANQLSELTDMAVLNFTDTIFEMPIGLITPWGYMSKMSISNLRGQSYFS